MKHSLSEVDIEKRTAICSVCCKIVGINKSGHGWSCKEKQKDYRKKNYNSDRYLNILRTISKRYVNVKSAAKIRNISFFLTKEEYEDIVSKPCYYCNNRLGKPAEFASGLNRLDSSIGYTIDNIVSSCMRCSRLKGDFLTPNETLLAVAAVIQYREGQNAQNK